MGSEATRQNKSALSSDIPGKAELYRRVFLASDIGDITPAGVPSPHTLSAKSAGHDFGRVRIYSSTATIQARLTVGAPDDQYEQEADRVADQVVANGNAPTQLSPSPEEDEVQTKPVIGTITPLVQREELPEEEEELQTKPVAGSIQRENLPEEEEETLQAKPAVDALQREALPEDEEELQMKSEQSQENVQAGAELENTLASGKGGGSPLSEDTRAFMEPRFGFDFSRVRIHTGNDAVQMNQQLSAQAFTHGSDIYFGPGKSPQDHHLLAHELTHVVQQTGASAPTAQRREEWIARQALSDAVVQRNTPDPGTPAPPTQDADQDTL